MIRRSVVLPLPLGPSSAVREPSAISSETSSSDDVPSAYEFTEMAIVSRPEWLIAIVGVPALRSRPD